MDDEETIPVTEANVQEYISKTIREKLYGKYATQIDAFVSGFKIATNGQVGNFLAPYELAKILEGGKSYSPDEYIKKIKFSPSGLAYGEFYDIERLIYEFTPEQRDRLVQFITGYSRLPFGGINSLPFDMNIKIEGSMSATALPIAATCSRSMTIPKYPNYAVMREKIILAIYEGLTYWLE